MRRHHELPFGAELTSDGVHFRLWAPRAKEVAVRVEGTESSPHPNPPPLAGEGGSPRERRAGGGPAEAIPMSPEPDGWFSLTTSQAQPGSRYRYIVDGAAYPDPASRHQPDGVHGASEVIDPGAHDWQDAEWQGRPREELVIYELHLGAFSPGGDCAGTVMHLDELAELGVTAIELMPIAEFPGKRNW